MFQFLGDHPIEVLCPIHSKMNEYYEKCDWKLAANNRSSQKNPVPQLSGSGFFMFTKTKVRKSWCAITTGGIDISGIRQVTFV